MSNNIHITLKKKKKSLYKYIIQQNRLKLRIKKEKYIRRVR